jgi:hypothetical protein
MIHPLRLYQYLFPVILTPLSFYLWWKEYQNWPQFFVAWLIPILWSYIVPAVGTNIFKVWEFDVKWKWGHFRPHHGFVFGSTTAMIAWLVHVQPSNTIVGIFQYALILSSVLGFWNYIYEVIALRTGIIKVYNQPWAEEKCVEAIAFDYAPWFFGGFGFAHGLTIGTLELIVVRVGLPSLFEGVIFASFSLLFCIAIPVLGYIRRSLKTHGHLGTRPIMKE